MSFLHIVQEAWERAKQDPDFHTFVVHLDIIEVPAHVDDQHIDIQLDQLIDEFVNLSDNDDSDENNIVGLATIAEMPEVEAREDELMAEEPIPKDGPNTEEQESEEQKSEEQKSEEQEKWERETDEEKNDKGFTGASDFNLPSMMQK